MARNFVDIVDFSIEEIDELIAVAEDIERLKKFRANPSDESWIAG